MKIFFAKPIHFAKAEKACIYEGGKLILTIHLQLLNIYNPEKYTVLTFLSGQYYFYGFGEIPETK